jgi:hypothetical protein
MKIRNNDNIHFAANVHIKRNYLKSLGQAALKGAEEVKPDLEKRGEDVAFKITRAYTIRAAGGSLDCPGSMLKPTDKMLISAKIKRIGFWAKLKGIFMTKQSGIASTNDFSKESIKRAALRAETNARKDKSESIFSVIGRLPGPM